MIVTALLSLVFMVVNFIIGLLGVIPSFPDELLVSAQQYIMYIVNGASGLFFFVIRPSTFQFAIDIVFFVWAAEPIYRMVMWVLRKIPFLHIS